MAGFFNCRRLQEKNKTAIFILPSARLFEKGASDKSDFSRPDPFLLFDPKATWTPPHNEHRKGTDADINQKDAGGVIVDCKKELKKVVEKVGQGQSFPKLKCESENRRHIDFD